MSGSMDARPGTGLSALAGAEAIAVVVSATVTAASYLLWLGWHAPKHLVPGTSSYVGPHEAWQVIGLVLTLGVIAAIGGWLGLATSTVWATSLAVTLMFAVEASTEHADDASLWPVGAAMLLFASLAGLFVVALLSHGLRRVGRALASR